MAAIRTFSRSECQGYQVISNSFGKNTLALVTGVRPTQDTAVLVQAALATIQAIYRPGFNYAKAGVMLLELSPQGMEQAELNWDEPKNSSYPAASI